MTPRRLSDQERLAWLRLARTETVGPVAFDHLITRFGTAERALDARRGGRVVAPRVPSSAEALAELEAGDRLGARLISAEQGRDVFAVPGSPLDPRAKGPNDLIRQGAILCEGVDDVLRALAGSVRARERERPYDPDEDPGDLDFEALRERLAALLSSTPVSRYELVRATKAPTPAVMAALVELALAGRAELAPGGLVAEASSFFP
jgi:DNA processing protein